MNIRHTLYINGILLVVLSALMLPPMIIDLIDSSETWFCFFKSSLVTLFAGLLLIFVNRGAQNLLKTKDMFLLLSLSWLIVTFFASLPFAWSGMTLSFTYSFFESASVITTTGISFIESVETLPNSLLLWRALLSWTGGIGFILVAIILLPYLQVNGMQIFQMHASHNSKSFEKTHHTAFYIFIIYGLLTAACATLLHLYGMSVFDSLCHAMAAISTSGVSNYTDSIGFFNSSSIEAIIITFMILGSLPFILYLRFLRGDTLSIIKDTQVQDFIKILFIFSFLLAIYIVLQHKELPIVALRHALFTVTSLVTTTGFSVESNAQWGAFIVTIAFLLSLIGGCSSSSSGGIKIFRFQILFEAIRFQLVKLSSPDRVLQMHYSKKPVDAMTVNSISIFFFVFIASLLVSSALLMTTGMDFISSFSGALSALSNSSHGITGILKVDETDLSQSAVWYLSISMIVGRLEIMPVLVILTRKFWSSN